MRLLKRNSAGEFILTKDFVRDDEVPPYAILSHTWVEGQEVSFEDLTNNAGKDKLGYEKIRFCGERASHDRLEYFWVDTCCINKANFTELSQAINSMFRWYQNAVKCYVYLSDVSTTKRKATGQSPDDTLPDNTWESAFRGSRWFKRGWTLQELLAPSLVEFFSRDRKLLGDKRTLERQIHDITKIAVPALRGTSLNQFGVEERFSWAENRQTTHKEDKAYSLFGIFDIQMPLLYGEGEEKALNRLRREIGLEINLVDRLPYASGAAFNSYTKQHEPTCLPDTRVDLLQTIYDWADGQDERCIFWLNGLAGTGKSTIARTVARRYFGEQRLGASFFFSKGSGDVGNASKFCTTIAVQLANNVPAFHRLISDAIMERSDTASVSLHDQWHQLVLLPLSKQNEGSPSPAYIIVIDALDECSNESDIRIILYLLAETRSLKTVRLRVFLTSRPEVPVRYGFCQMLDADHQDFVLHNISQSIVDHDIFTFLEFNLRLIGQERSLDPSWPGEEAIRCLIQTASGLFIWVATACKFIREGKRFADKRLQTIIKGGGNAGAITAPERQLDEIYATVLRHSISSEYTDDEKEESYHMLRQVLGSIAVLFSPLSRHSLSSLLNITKEDIDQTLEDLHSVLDVPIDRIRPLRLHHPSFRDYLLDKKRCTDSNFSVDEKQAHWSLAESCIQIMSTSLKEDICGVRVPGTMIADLEGGKVEMCLPLEVQYACLYWVQHVQKSGAPLTDEGQIHHFLQTHLLYWLEGLAWMQKVSEGILEIISLESATLSNDCPDLRAFIHDAKRFILQNRPVIELAPLQIYCSALYFTPRMSIVRRQFKNKIPQWIKRGPEVESDWSPELQILETSSVVHNIAFSYDGTRLAYGLHNGTIRVHDVATGATRLTLEGHSSPVNAVSFSPNNMRLASCSQRTLILDGCRVIHDHNGETVRIWDLDTGAMLRSLERYEYVTKLTFSPEGSRLAYLVADQAVQIWDEAMGVTTSWPFKSSLGRVDAIAFSPNGTPMLSSLKDGTVQVWDVATGAILQTFENHSDPFTMTAFSSSGTLLVCRQSAGTLQLLDLATRATLQTIKSYWGMPPVFALSPDNTRLALGLYHGTVEVWDTASGGMLSKLKIHSNAVSAVAFSPDSTCIASSSPDKTVRIWDMALGVVQSRLERHSKWITTIAFSPNAAMLASALDDKRIRLWDTATGLMLATLKGHSGQVQAVAFSPDSTLLASSSVDRTIRLWDVATGVALETLTGHSNLVGALAFSPDGTWLASGSQRGSSIRRESNIPHDRMVLVWDVTMRGRRHKLEGHTASIHAVTFSPSCKWLASGSEDKTVRVWDVVTGATAQTLGHTDTVCAVAFSPDGMRLLSSSEDRRIQVWDFVTGAKLQTLEVDVPIRTLLFSSEESGIVTERGRLDATALYRNSASAPLNTPSAQLSASPCGIWLQNEWIQDGAKRMLWLPPDYRRGCSAVRKNLVCLSHRSGRVSIFELTFSSSNESGRIANASDPSR